MRVSLNFIYKMKEGDDIFNERILVAMTQTLVPPSFLYSFCVKKLQQMKKENNRKEDQEERVCGMQNVPDFQTQEPSTLGLLLRTTRELAFMIYAYWEETDEIKLLFTTNNTYKIYIQSIIPT